MKKKLYLITGANGHLGSCLIKRLLNDNNNIRGLYLANENNHIPDKVEAVMGNVLDKESLLPFFNCDGYDEVNLIHCAAIVSIESKTNPMIYKVNVEGTRNVMDLALENKIDKVIYVSTVHAIKEEEYPTIIKETKDFNPDYVSGQYGKSKAIATNMVLEYASRGLNVSIVHPSGILGPGDINKSNNSINSLIQMYEGKIPVSLSGGYDFVDVRDVVEGIVSCLEKGRKGECYILSGQYMSVKDMINEARKLNNKKPINIEIPAGLVKLIAPLTEFVSIKLLKTKPLLTPYSFYVLQGNALFSNEKAKKELGYTTREIKETIKDTVLQDAITK